MSEAMTNREIEDVLSSIRRLVAQEVRAPVERLILTPAQRVPAIGAEPPILAAVRAVARAPEPPPPEEAEPEPPRSDAPASNPEPVAAAANTATPPDVTGIDTAELAPLIARLVREELRGQLGEKITLQVRKLVRAEIARALEERDLLG